ncbi:MAG: DUF3426 domain-containing protein [Gammaproteobacteria bacterium]|nr:DUF3426 domain-containing protein [Gammaproteobacteria bacterium]
MAKPSKYLLFIFLVTLVWQVFYFRPAELEAWLWPVRKLVCPLVYCDKTPIRENRAWQIINGQIEVIQSNALWLHLQVKQTRTYPVLTPHLKIELKDQVGNLLTQRVFSPQSLQWPAYIDGQNELNKEATLSLNVASTVSAITYKLDLFYP